MFIDFYMYYIRIESETAGTVSIHCRSVDNLLLSPSHGIENPWYSLNLLHKPPLTPSSLIEKERANH